MSPDDSSKSAEKREEMGTVYIPAGVYEWKGGPIQFMNCTWEPPVAKPTPPEEKRDSA